MKLNARQIVIAKPKDKTCEMADGGGLYLEISGKGSKYWRMKYRRPSDKKEDGFLRIGPKRPYSLFFPNVTITWRIGFRWISRLCYLNCHRDRKIYSYKRNFALL